MIFLVIAWFNLPLLSQDSIPYNWERFSFSLGGFLSSNNSDISIAGTEMGLGITIDLEDALGLNTTTFVARGEVDYNFGSRRRSHVRLGYFGLIRHADKILESEIEIGDFVYPIGTEVGSKLDLHIIRGLYDYSYYSDERVRLGLSAGLYVLPVNFSIGAGQVINESATIIAPLPVVGLRNAFYITPRLLLKQNVEVLYVKAAGIEGKITDLNVWVEFNPFKHLGIGLGYNTFRFYFSATDSIRRWEFEGSVNTGITGLLLYGKYYF